MEENDTMIDLDIEGNPDMNIYDCRRIQDKLQKNRKDYNDERLREFRERKMLENEKDMKNNCNLDVETTHNIIDN